MEEGVWSRYLKYLSHVCIRLNCYNIFTLIPIEVKFYWSNRGSENKIEWVRGRKERGRKRERNRVGERESLEGEYGLREEKHDKLEEKKVKLLAIISLLQHFFFQVYKYVKSSTEENGLQMQNSKKNKIKRRSKTALKRLSLKCGWRSAFHFTVI